MLSKLSPALVAFGGSVLLLAGLIGALYWTNDTGRPSPSGEPLIVYCAEAMRVPLDAIAKEYETEYGHKVVLHFGPSQAILAKMDLMKNGDLFLPADDSYIQEARAKGLISAGDVFNLARMNAVVIVRPDFPKVITSWNDFLAKENKIGLANPEVAAISKLVKKELETAGLWKGVEQHKPTYLGNVNEVFNSVHNIKSIDVGIVWDVTASPHPGAKVVKLKELSNVQARVQIGIVKSTKQRDHVLQFIRYLRAEDKGAPHLLKQGFSDIEKRGPMDQRRELVVHAGAMLRPALEDALIEFEKRENVRITRVYNGCGLLVSQMKTGETPDVYFACDTSFMTQVTDRFDTPINVSTNQLMITVKKGNPKEVTKLLDLGQPGLRVGVGHEHNCALGALTKETFLRTGVYAKVVANIKVEAPTGDTLVNQLRVGSLDVVIAYRSNIEPFLDELEGIPIEGIKCATPSQPIAVSKSTAHPDLSKLLVAFLRTQESRERFESLGFGWEVKEVEAKK